MAQANKKIAAALAAVNAYLQEEQMLAQQNERPFPGPQAFSQEISLWSHSGRQDMMNLRQLVQMKAFSR